MNRGISQFKTAVVTLCLLFSGCLPGPPSPSPSPAPTPQPSVSVSASAIFGALADRIDGQHVADSDELCGILAKLRDAGDLTAADVARFDAAFAGLAKSNRPLTAADSAKLRSL